MQKTAIVTGGARGIGESISRKLAAEGYRVAIVYHKSADRADALVKELNADAFRAIAVCADVCDENQIRDAVGRVRAVFGGIDVLVNNAGVALNKLFIDTTAADWRSVFAVNTDSAFYFSQAVMPDLTERGGAIVNISSVWGIYGASCEVAYSASKAAMIGFTQALAQEIGRMGVRVNCVAPGVIATEMNASLSAQDLAALKDSAPLYRIGTPEEVAEAVAFLASDRAGFITGQTLSVTGGFKG